MFHLLPMCNRKAMEIQKDKQSRAKKALGSDIQKKYGSCMEVLGIPSLQVYLELK